MLRLLLAAAAAAVAFHFLSSSSSSSLFVLASTSPPPPPFSTREDPDAAALLAFKSSLAASGPAAVALSSCNASAGPCSSPSAWRGVSCRDGRVVRLVLEGLRLDGPLDDLTRLPRLSLLSLSNNSFSYLLHRLHFSRWTAHLKLLYLSHNRFSGPFPSGILLLHRLRRLDLAGNLISGAIPLEIGGFLSHLLTLRLEENGLAGTIPASLGSITGLMDFNVSRNRLGGRIPLDLAFFPPSSFAENGDLCGYPLPIKCSNKTANSNGKTLPSNARARRKFKWVITAVVLLIAVIAIATVAAAALWCIRGRMHRKNASRETISVERKRKEVEVEGRIMEFFQGCKEFELEDLLRGSAEMLGRGAACTTYRVSMDGVGEEGDAIVVKRVRRGNQEEEGEKKNRRDKDSRTTEAECRLLREMGQWQHPNVVSLRAFCSSPDDLLLVFDYVPGGSLFDLLHGSRGPGRIPLPWSTRLKLAMDAARGLAYLHDASKAMLSHLHLTSSNVLVDGDGNALISDFALHELVSSPPASSFNSSSRVASSRTFSSESPAAAPQKDDAYSFGVILLEILTGRPAEDGGGGMDLARWVQTVVREEWTSEVFDFELAMCKEAEDEMFALLQVALLCTAREAKDRPRMGVVCKMIEEIRERGNRSRGGSLSPSLRCHSNESSSPCLSEDNTPTTTFASC